MKTRVSALAAAISAISVFALPGCGGNGGGADSPSTDYTPPAVPVVTVNAPATATAGFPFTIGWTATDPTGAAVGTCVADFDSAHAGANESFPHTEDTAGTKTFSVTCEGAGGKGTGFATVIISGAPTPAGLWQGTNTAGGTRAVSGVVTNEADYWLAYAQPGNSGTIVGFYTGTGTSKVTGPTGGTYTSADLREINFAGGFSGGNAAAGTLDSGVFTSKTSFSGVLSTIPSGAVTGVHFDNITSSGFVGNAPPGNYTTDTGTGGSATLAPEDGPATLTIQNLSTVIAINPVTSSGANDSATIVSDEVLNGTVSAGVFTPTNDGSSYSLPKSCTPIQTAGATNTVCDGAGVGTKAYFVVPVGVPGVGVGGSLNLTTGTTTLFSRRAATGTIMRRTTYTFPSSSLITNSLPGIAAGTFDLSTYDPAYDTAPTLTALAGNYSVGSWGVGVSQVSAPLTIAADGAISGTAGACSVSGNAVVHPTGGNVYDVTLTFSGGSCAYTSKGQFAGVATYDATTHQAKVMALNSARDTGFLFVGTK